MPETPAPADPLVVRMTNMRVVPDGDRQVLQVVGATTVPPASIDGRYIGPNGYVDDIHEASNIRGAPGGSASGTQGPQGPAGVDGKSAYQTWLDNGHSGGQAAFLAANKGEQGPQGTPGLKGDTGDAGPQGTQGAKGETGTPGPQGSTGPAGQAGAKGDTGAAGPTGTVGAQGPQGVKGDTGAAGAQGLTGPSGAALVGTVTLAETSLVTLALAVRRVTRPLTGAEVGGSYVAAPVGAPPANYSIQDCYCTTAGQITVGIIVPPLGVASSYSIPVKIYKLG